ncbi:MAG TPA: porphobilinogen synthase [Dehalococcoidia bacterium]|nr:porphobilinogen synthase [Dehalococcoidia bacterium]
MGEFPYLRMRRLRQSEGIRAMVRETEVRASDLVYPLFVVPGRGVRKEISSLLGNYHLSVDELVRECEQVAGLGVPAVILFGIPESKDAIGSGAYAGDGVVQQAIRALKQKVPELVIITDVCLCEYTSHGHCGVVVESRVDNDRSLELITKTALSHAEAGADMVAPSDMMDGRVAAIRSLLDENGFEMTPIMAYAAKYDSAFYGPFREAAGSTPQFGDRRSYQMDSHNVREALREVRLDIEEGADVVMVKPALAYLDVVRRVRESFDMPLAAYNVSGEYAMVKAAAAQGLLNEKRAVLEVLTAIKRAGADIILTYHAKDAAGWLKAG